MYYHHDFYETFEELNLFYQIPILQFSLNPLQSAFRTFHDKFSQSHRNMTKSLLMQSRTILTILMNTITLRLDQKCFNISACIKQPRLVQPVQFKPRAYNS